MRLGCLGCALFGDAHLPQLELEIALQVQINHPTILACVTALRSDGRDSPRARGWNYNAHNAVHCNPGNASLGHLTLPNPRSIVRGLNLKLSVILKYTGKLIVRVNSFVIFLTVQPIYIYTEQHSTTCMPA